jgi:hypothetical protein
MYLTPYPSTIFTCRLEIEFVKEFGGGSHGASKAHDSFGWFFDYSDHFDQVLSRTFNQKGQNFEYLYTYLVCTYIHTYSLHK